MEVEIVVLDARYADHASRLKDILVAAAAHMGITDAHAEAYVVGNAFMEKNVLAYPVPEGFPRPDLGTARDLGELYINPEHIAAHGEDFSFMAVHAFLHLLGYDHHGKHDTVKMEAKEQEILAAILPKTTHE
ncbi:MAG: rRNA maturation RNAse YbeY [bacterium]|nr:rRNA maturation RNAse YbeY [bacterium]